MGALPRKKIEQAWREHYRTVEGIGESSWEG
jgi:hypothetical protein